MGGSSLGSVECVTDITYRRLGKRGEDIVLEKLRGKNKQDEENSR